MDEETLRVLVVPGQRPRDVGRLTGGVERKRLLAALASAGIRVRHDSGGGLVVVEIDDERQDALLRSFSGLKVENLVEGIGDRVGDVDEQDTLFVRALEIRANPRYREAKRRRVPGETAEEQLLLTAPCTPPED